MRLSDFDFDLPVELIAQTAVPRGESRLLVLSRDTGAIAHASIRDLPRYLSAGDLLVVNDTRVFPARLLGHRVPSGGAVECLLLARESEDADGQIWSALMHPGQKLKPGARVRFEPAPDRPSPGSAGVLMGEVLERQFFGRRRIRIWIEGSGTIDQMVDAIGHVPLPPYIHRPDSDADRERYQTLFATNRGSVAAPTAGLHFDRQLIEALRSAGIAIATITLHVGYGTFKPVRVEHVEDHQVDAEPYEISESAAEAINETHHAGRRIVAVGTTTTRALEEAVRRGNGRVAAGRGEATLFIHPGVEFLIVSALVTNFHLPKSSLLMLVSAFADRPSPRAGRPEPVEGRERVLATYREAIAQRYRFYSYGDAMLIANP
jgi:S-adenosylmethionine:tRNA ribosyltransferase-isomerase